MNNKAINEFGFRRIWRIKQLSERVIRHAGEQGAHWANTNKELYLRHTHREKKIAEKNW